MPQYDPHVVIVGCRRTEAAQKGDKEATHRLAGLQLDVAIKNLVDRLGDRLVAVALFGSFARGEQAEHSDIDLLVVARGMERGFERRFQIYDSVQPIVKRDVTLVDVDESDIFREDLVVNAFLLNAAWDGKILYDPSGNLGELFKRIKKLIEVADLERYRTPDGAYGWRRKDGKPIKPIELRG